MSRGPLVLLLLLFLGATGCFRELPPDPQTVTLDGATNDAGMSADAGVLTEPDAGAGLKHDAGEGDAQVAPGCIGEACCDAAAGDCGGCHDQPCAAALPVCDDETGQCRGCTRDAECGVEAVCIEADGICVADLGVAFVTEWGADEGACTRTAPCASLPYALSHVAERKVIHVLGGALSTYASIAIAAPQGLVLDGEDTAISSVAPAALSIGGRADLTIEGFRFKAAQATDAGAVTVGELANVRLFDVRFAGDGGMALWTSGEAKVAMRKVHVGNLTSSTTTEVRCLGARLTVEESTFETSVVGGHGSSCQLTLSRNRFESAYDGSVRMSGGVLVMENNLVIHRDGYNDSVSVANMYPGSTVRFNTFVNTTALPSDGAALYCDGSVIVTSNVFAYHSGHPITGVGCETRYSVFDDMAQNSAGTGNRVASIDALFVDRAGGDYRLAEASKALGAAEPGLEMVPSDFDGAARPAPAGSRADSGAFESP